MLVLQEVLLLQTYGTLRKINSGEIENTKSYPVLDGGGVYTLLQALNGAPPRFLFTRAGGGRYKK